MQRMAFAVQINDAKNGPSVARYQKATLRKVKVLFLAHMPHGRCMVR